MSAVYPLLDLRIVANSEYLGCGKRRHVWMQWDGPWFDYRCVRCGKLQSSSY